MTEIKQSLRAIKTRFEHEFALARRGSPQLRDQLTHGYRTGLESWRLIEAVFTAYDLPSSGIPMPPDGRWPARRRLSDADVWHFLPSGGAPPPPVELWGATAINAISMIRKLHTVAEEIAINAIDGAEEWGASTIACIMDPVCGCPYVMNSCDQEPNWGRFRVAGDGIDVQEHRLRIPDADFIQDEASRFRPAGVPYDGNWESHLGDDADEVKRVDSLRCEQLIRVLRETHKGRPIVSFDIGVLHDAMSFYGARKARSQRLGVREPHLHLGQLINDFLRNVEADLRGSAIPEWQLWDDCTDDGIPAHPDSVFAWSRLQNLFRNATAKYLEQVSLENRVLARMEAEREQQMSAPPPIEPAPEDLSLQGSGYQRERLAERLGIGLTKLDTLRADLKCAKSSRGVPFLIPPADAVKLAGHLVKESAVNSKVYKSSLDFLETDFPDHVPGRSGFNLDNPNNPAEGNGDRGI